MRASVTLDDDLLKMAHEYTGMTERALKGEPSDLLVYRSERELAG